MRIRVGIVKMSVAFLFLLSFAGCGGGGSSGGGGGGNVLAINGQVNTVAGQTAGLSRRSLLPFQHFARFFLPTADAYSSTGLPNASVTLCTLSNLGVVSLSNILDSGGSPVFTNVPSTVADGSGHFTLNIPAPFNFWNSGDTQYFGLKGGTAPLFLCASDGGGTFTLFSLISLDLYGNSAAGSYTATVDPATTAAWYLLCGKSVSSSASSPVDNYCGAVTQSDLDNVDSAVANWFADNPSVIPTLDQTGGGTNSLPYIAANSIATDTSVSQNLQTAMTDSGSTDTVPNIVPSLKSIAPYFTPPIVQEASSTVVTLPKGFPSSLPAGTYSFQACIFGGTCYSAGNLTLSKGAYLFFVNEMESMLLSIEEANNSANTVGSGYTNYLMVVYSSAGSSFSASVTDINCGPTPPNGLIACHTYTLLNIDLSPV